MSQRKKFTPAQLERFSAASDRRRGTSDKEKPFAWLDKLGFSEGAAADAEWSHSPQRALLDPAEMAERVEAAKITLDKARKNEQIAIARARQLRLHPPSADQDVPAPAPAPKPTVRVNTQFRERGDAGKAVPSAPAQTPPPYNPKMKIQYIGQTPPPHKPIMKNQYIDKGQPSVPTPSTLQETFVNRHRQAPLELDMNRASVWKADSQGKIVPHYYSYGDSRSLHVAPKSGLSGGGFSFTKRNRKVKKKKRKSKRKSKRRKSRRKSKRRKSSRRRRR